MALFSLLFKRRHIFFVGPNLTTLLVFLTKRKGNFGGWYSKFTYKKIMKNINLIVSSIVLKLKQSWKGVFWNDGGYSRCTFDRKFLNLINVRLTACANFFFRNFDFKNKCRKEFEDIVELSDSWFRNSFNLKESI